MTNSRTLDYASNDSESRRLKQSVGVFLFVVAGLIAARLGDDLAYRLTLFFGTYGAKVGLNHVDDGSFFRVYAWGAIGTFTALAGALVMRRRLAWLLVAATTAANLVACLSFLAMHHSGALVEYGEWCKLHGH